MLIFPEERCTDKLIQEMQQYFEELENVKTEIKKDWEECIMTFDYALQFNSFEIIKDLTLYLEMENGSKAFKYIGDARKMWVICNIITIEREKKLPLFCSDCLDFNAILEKYILTTYALRRISLNLSDESRQQAIIFLQEKGISNVAVSCILGSELIIIDDAFIDIMNVCFRNIWSWEELENLKILRGQIQKDE